MRYCKGQRLRVVAEDDAVFIVAEMPDTYSAFGKPAYLLRTGVLVKNDRELIVLPDQIVDRSKYVPLLPFLPEATPPVFRRLCLVREKETKIVSIIYGLPAEHRMAESFEPAYLLRGPDGIAWAIAQTVVEDGRYELLPNASHSDCDAS